MTIEYVIDGLHDNLRPRREPPANRSRTSMRVVKHETQVTCPWCKAGATMTFQDARGEYCMACKKDVKTGRPMPK